MKTLTLYTILFFSCAIAHGQSMTFSRNKESALSNQIKGTTHTQLTYLETSTDITPELLLHAAEIMEYKIGYVELHRVGNRQLAVLHEHLIPTEHVLHLFSALGNESKVVSTTVTQLK